MEPAVSLGGRPLQTERRWSWQLNRYTVRLGRATGAAFTAILDYYMR